MEDKNDDNSISHQQHSMVEQNNQQHHVTNSNSWILYHNANVQAPFFAANCQYYPNSHNNSPTNFQHVNFPINFQNGYSPHYQNGVFFQNNLHSPNNSYNYENSQDNSPVNFENSQDNDMHNSGTYVDNTLTCLIENYINKKSKEYNKITFDKNDKAYIRNIIHNMNLDGIYVNENEYFKDFILYLHESAKNLKLFIIFDISNIPAEIHNNMEDYISVLNIYGRDAQSIKLHKIIIEKNKSATITNTDGNVCNVGNGLTIGSDDDKKLIISSGNENFFVRKGIIKIYYKESISTIFFDNENWYFSNGGYQAEIGSFLFSNDELTVNLLNVYFDKIEI